MQRIHQGKGYDGPPHGYYNGLYKGIVEQRVDPERLGRLRVRVVGIHGNNIPTNHLPWAWPRLSACQEGGIFWIPPISEWVWVTFEAGNYEYPVWDGGWWNSGSTAQGQQNSRHVDWPTNNFGGDAWPRDSILKLEKVKGVRKQDAPNNFTIISPLQKHLEFDDRRNKQKIKLSDWQDNFYYLNTERGVITTEAVEGARQSGQRKSRGLTLSSNAGNFEAIQLYSAGHWYMTIDDLKEVFDLNTPGRHRVVVDDKNDRIELWVNEGHHIIIDQVKRRIVARTAQGRMMILDDQNQTYAMNNPSESSYYYHSDKTQHTEVRSSGSLAIKAVGDINISSGGRINIDGLAGIFLNSGYYDAIPTLSSLGIASPDQLPKDLEYSHPVNSQVSRKVPRAPDYPEQVPEPPSAERGIPPGDDPSDTIS